MKTIIAIIQPTKLEPVREALEKFEITRMTVGDSQGFARQRGRQVMYRGREYACDLLRKVTLEIVVNDDFVEKAIETIANVARTGKVGTIGDGKIFVIPTEEVIDISNGLRGKQAVN